MGASIARIKEGRDDLEDNFYVNENELKLCIWLTWILLHVFILMNRVSGLLQSQKYKMKSSNIHRIILDISTHQPVGFYFHLYSRCQF